MLSWGRPGARTPGTDGTPWVNALAVNNLSALHRATSERLGRAPRLAHCAYHKQGELYHELSWTDYRRRADRAAAGLIDRGVRPGDRVGILAENGVDWLTADIAILAAGAADVPVHAPKLTGARSNTRYSGHSGGPGGGRQHAGAQANKVLASIDRLPRAWCLLTSRSSRSTPTAGLPT